jgi:hypothetical protein
MWFDPGRDPKRFLSSLWYIGKWLVMGPLIGGGLLALVGFFLVGVEGAINGFYIGLAFGTMGSAMTAGGRALSRLDE